MSDQSPFHIVFSVNVRGLPGLGATISSLISNCSAPEDLRIIVLCTNIPAAHQANIHRLFEYLEFGGSYELIPYEELNVFAGLPGLLGDITPYVRLRIPELVSAPQALYLDSDLIITVDILELSNIEMDGHVIAAAASGTAGQSFDSRYFSERGFPTDMPYFNSGVLLLDLDAWRERKFGARWRAIIRDRPQSIPTVDQTILNRMSAGSFKPLPRKFNAAYLAHYDPPDYDKAIFHFIGSPKPWDFMGSLIHGGYQLWRRYSPPFWEEAYQAFSRQRLGRAWHIRRSMARAVMKRYK